MLKLPSQVSGPAPRGVPGRITPAPAARAPLLTSRVCRGQPGRRPAPSKCFLPSAGQRRAGLTARLVLLKKSNRAARSKHNAPEQTSLSGNPWLLLDWSFHCTGQRVCVQSQARRPSRLHAGGARLAPPTPSRGAGCQHQADTGSPDIQSPPVPLDNHLKATGLLLG